MTRGASWARVKSKLRRTSAPELLSVIQDLYRASPENRRFLHARFLPSEASLEEYRRRVVVAIFPDPLSRNPVRIGEAERLIRQYRLSTGDQVGVVDLMLSMVEAGTEQAADVGYGDDAYFGCLRAHPEIGRRGAPVAAAAGDPLDRAAPARADTKIPRRSGGDTETR